MAFLQIGAVDLGRDLRAQVSHAHGRLAQVDYHLTRREIRRQSRSFRREPHGVMDLAAIRREGKGYLAVAGIG